jgi:hypothetical protein
VCLAGALTAVVAASAPGEAAADGFFATTDCSDGECRVGASSPPAPSSSGGQSASEGAAGGTDEAGEPCVFTSAEFLESGKEGPLPIPQGMARCEGAAAGGGASGVFSPEVLAEQARAVMRLPEPAIGTAPAPDKPRFVNLPTWLWVAGEEWSPVSVTASVSAGSVTVVATPERVVWDTGDGHQVVCAGPGTVFSRATAGEGGSPDCGHTYTALPPGGAGTAVDVTAVWEWGVSWSTTDGRGGALEDLATSSSVAVPVSEIHSVVTHTR